MRNDLVREFRRQISNANILRLTFLFYSKGNSRTKESRNQEGCSQDSQEDSQEGRTQEGNQEGSQEGYPQETLSIYCEIE